MKQLLFVFGLLLNIGICSSLHALSLSAVEDPTGKDYLTAEVEELRTRLRITHEYLSLTNEGQSLVGVGLGVGIKYSPLLKWAIAGDFRQNFSLTGGFQSLSSVVEVSIAYSIMGRQQQQAQRITISGEPVSLIRDYQEARLLVAFYLSQYFFYTSSAILPFSGAGLSMSYVFPSSGSVSYEVGIRVDRIRRNTGSLHPFYLFARLLIWP